MKMALGHILCVICFFVVTGRLHGQTTADMDEKLIQYELLCKNCLELKSLVADGAKVPRAHAKELIGRFVEMNREIKAVSLTASQSRKFEMINRWFSTGERPHELDNPIRIEPISPEPRVPAASDRETALILPSPATPSPARDIALQKYFMADISLPLSYGIMIGLQKGIWNEHDGIRWGGYIRFRSNFISSEADYTCMSDGTMPDNHAFWGNGQSRRHALSVTAGGLAGLNHWLDIYAGAGYGQQSLMWQDVDGRWASVQDHTHKGPSLELGILASWREFCIGAGLSTVSFKTVSTDFSIGFRF